MSSIWVEDDVEQYENSWLDFHTTYKILNATHLKHTSFWLSIDDEPIRNNVAHAMPWQCMFALSVCLL